MSATCAVCGREVSDGWHAMALAHEDTFCSDQCQDQAIREVLADLDREADAMGE